MTTLRWTPGVAAVAQQTSYACGGTWEADDLIRVVIGSKTVDFVAGSTVTATVVSNLVSAYNALDSSVYPEFAELTADAPAATTFRLTADTAGVPFTATLTPLEAGGGAADAQTIEGAGTATTGTLATSPTGPNWWSAAGNWSTGAVPVNSDIVYLENSSVSIRYGLAQSAVTLAELHISDTFTGDIGLPEINQDATDYHEYRATFLAIAATVLNIGTGDGSGAGSGRLKIDNGSVQTTLTVYGTGGASEPDVPALVWKGTHASNVVNVYGGSVGLSVYGTDSAVVATLRVEGGGTAVRCGDSCAVTTLTMAGGTVLFDGATVTTVTQDGGTLTLRDSGTVTTLTVNEGALVYRSAGTITTLAVGAHGVADFTQDVRGRTITNLVNVYPGGALLDGFATVTFSAGYKVVGGKLTDAVIDVGYGRTYTPS